MSCPAQFVLLLLGPRSETDPLPIGATLYIRMTQSVRFLIWTVVLKRQMALKCYYIGTFLLGAIHVLAIHRAPRIRVSYRSNLKSDYTPQAKEALC